MTLDRTGRVQSFTAAEFKARCLSIFDSLGPKPEEVVVTKNGRAVARVVRSSKRKVRRPAHLAHLYEYIGDIEAPLGVEWKAMK